jgi:hypothetical protein
MAIPSSGIITAEMINLELGRSGTASFSLKDACTGVYSPINTNSAFRPDGVAPHTYGEWHGYDHSIPPTARFSYYQDFWELASGDCSAGDGTKISLYTEGSSLGVGDVLSLTPDPYTGFTNNINYSWYSGGSRYRIVVRLISGELTVDNIVFCSAGDPPII